jgi:hypothetical protein
MLFRTLAIGTIALTSAACGAWTEGHRDVAMNSFRNTTLEKASFALDCPAEKLEVKLVPESEAFPNNALVGGCGQKATFVRVGGDWVMESGPGR